ncbi:preprotein translocase subunit SecG [uncultured Sphingomonas sp.]|jgi:preprotein translocase subunit SecG|uniref:preprotein translocase subunit SecG n=1 Tax=uncultured Sphingomonas sp. TaxID=158754 RepID=UPI0025F72D1E|nr:preprotein translocase subunit SecG [uncultured Sphingomonas sp.]
MFTFLLIVQTLVALALAAVILMQRSEGGGLGVGGSSAGLMTARGAADFLTRATTILGTVFVVLCIALAAIAGTRGDAQSVDASVANQVAPATPISPLEPGGNPLSAPPAGPNTAPPNNAAPGSQQPADNGAVPLAQ